MDAKRAEVCARSVAASIGVVLSAVRIEPLPTPFLNMRVTGGDELILGPALVEELSPEALSYAIAHYLNDPFAHRPSSVGPVFGASLVLSLAAGAAVVAKFGSTLAGFLVAVPLTLAAFVVYTLLFMIPIQIWRSRAATRQALRIAGLAAGEEFVAKSRRFALGGTEAVDRGLGMVPNEELARLRKMAARMGIS